MSKKDKSEVIQHFDAWSARYEKEIWIRDKHFHNLLKAQVLNNISNIDEQEILELGVGTGVYLNKFLQMGCHITGADISLQMIKNSRAKLIQKTYNHYNLILCDAEYLPFRKHVFDVVNCIEVLRHLPSPYKTLWNVFREARRILKTSGYYLINLPNILFPLNLFSVIYYMIPRTLMRVLNKQIGYHYNQIASFPHFPVLYNEPEDHMFNLLFLKRLFRQLEFKVTYFRGIFFFPASPRLFYPLLKRIDHILGLGFWRSLAYSFFFKLKRI